MEKIKKIGEGAWTLYLFECPNCGCIRKLDEEKWKVFRGLSVAGIVTTLIFGAPLAGFTAIFGAMPILMAGGPMAVAVAKLLQENYKLIARMNERTFFRCPNCGCSDLVRMRDIMDAVNGNQKPECQVSCGSVEHAALPNRSSNVFDEDTIPGEKVTITLPGGVSMKFFWCPATTSEAWKRFFGVDFFLMGSPVDELGRDADEVLHAVRLTWGFWIAQSPVTCGQYKAVTGVDKSREPGWANIPVHNISWNECMQFCESLSSMYRHVKFSLPTEAQWEYACRAGTLSALNNGRDLTTSNGVCPNLGKVAWYKENSDNALHSVICKKKGNHWNIFDMHGNVWEWCMDLYGKYPTNLQIDPIGADIGSCRVARGGSSYSDASFCRAAKRLSIASNKTCGDLGFRPIMF